MSAWPKVDLPDPGRADERDALGDPDGQIGVMKNGAACPFDGTAP